MSTNINFGNYQPQAFDEEAYKADLRNQMYGSQASKKDIRRFNRQITSQRGLATIARAKQEHDLAEQQKYADAYMPKAAPVAPATPVSTAKLGDPYTNLPEIYKTQSFDEQAYKDQLLTEMYGEQASKKDKRKFDTYIQSEAGLQAQKDAKAAFDKAERDKWSQSYKAYSSAIDAQHKARVQASIASLRDDIAKVDVSGGTPPAEPGKPAIIPRSHAEWNRIAKENGFADMGEVMAWQEANGLEADGKFGSKSSEFFKTNGLGKYQKTPEGYAELSRPDGTTFLQRTKSQSDTSVTTPATPVSTPNTTSQTTPTTGFDLDAFSQSQGLKSNAFVTHNGKRYLRYDPSDVGDFYIGEDGSMYRAKWGGGVGEMIDHSKHLTYSTPNGTRWDRNYNDVYNKINAFKKATIKKQGGTMNRINYFQQGGAAPQQDMQQQIVALVQAAMQGDQKATQTVNKIMEAAKAGDQQAMQIAQLMEQVIKQMKGQATAAKYGAKLNYLQSLKCGGKSKAKKKEQGGKVCPACG